MKNVFDVGEDSVHFAVSNIAWDVGHLYTVYGPLLRGCCSVMFEGSPVYPDAGAIWKVCESHKVTSMYICPSDVRRIKKRDFEGTKLGDYDLSSLKTVSLVGERGDADTVNWLHKYLPDVIINDTYWQTESGMPMAANCLNLEAFTTVFPSFPGSVTRPVPGFELKVLDSDNKETEVDIIGKVVVKKPLPPGFTMTLYGKDSEFVEKYMTETPGYYTTGDSGMVDENGYIHIMSRTDEIITTNAGDMLTTGKLEEVINGHEEVVESAVVPYNSKMRGIAPLAFVVLKDGNSAEVLEDKLEGEEAEAGDLGTAFAEAPWNAE
jgi:propionyl-CoA synthetase